MGWSTRSSRARLGGAEGGLLCFLIVMHSKRVFHNFPSKCPEPKCQFQKIQSRGSLQIHPNSSQNSETLSDAPNHHSWSISYAFSRPNLDFENLIFGGSPLSQPIPKSFKLAGPLPKPYFFQKNSRLPGVSNCQNLWTRLGTHLNLSLKAHSVVVCIYIYIWCVYQTSDFSETVFGLCHLIVKRLRRDKSQHAFYLWFPSHGTSFSTRLPGAVSD